MLAVKPDAAEGACRALGADRGDPGALHRGRACPAPAWRPRWAASPWSCGPCPTRRRWSAPGVTAISGGSFATSADLAWAEDVLSAVGTVVRLPERLLDAVTGLSGSGPAYFFLVAEALIEAGRADGARPARSAGPWWSRRCWARPRCLTETGRDPEALRAMVTSPAGTTAAGIRALEAQGGALGLHGGGGGRHRAVAQPAALSGPCP